MENNIMNMLVIMMFRKKINSTCTKRKKKKNARMKFDMFQIAYQNGVLASAGCDIAVGVWKPKGNMWTC
jgi:hypothetical protein